MCFANNTAARGLNAWGEVTSAQWKGWWWISRKCSLVWISNRLHDSVGGKTQTLWSFSVLLLLVCLFLFLRGKTILNSETSVLDKVCGHVCRYWTTDSSYLFYYSWQETWIKVKAHSLRSCAICRREACVKQTSRNQHSSALLNQERCKFAHKFVKGKLQTRYFSIKPEQKFRKGCSSKVMMLLCSTCIDLAVKYNKKICNRVNDYSRSFVLCRELQRILFSAPVRRAGSLDCYLPYLIICFCECWELENRNNNMFRGLILSHDPQGLSTTHSKMRVAGSGSGKSYEERQLWRFGLDM